MKTRKSIATILILAALAAGLDHGTRWWQRRLGARVRAANVLDQPRRDVVGYPLPGRSFHASVELSWP